MALNFNPPAFAPRVLSCPIYDCLCDTGLSPQLNTFRSLAAPACQRASQLGMLTVDAERGLGRPKEPSPEYPASPPNQVYAILPHCSGLVIPGKAGVYRWGKDEVEGTPFSQP